MEGQFIFGVCKEPFHSNNAWHVLIHALRFVGGPGCKPDDFPDEEGNVFWSLGPERPPWVHEGALCTLQTTRAPRYGEPGFCWYQAVRGSVAPVASELIDVSRQVSSEDALLHSRDFYVDWPVPSRIYVRIHDYVYGPFQVEQRKRRVALVEDNQEYIYYRYRWFDVHSTLAFRVQPPEGKTRWVLENEEGFASLDKSPRDGRTTTQLINWYLRGLRKSANVPEEIRNQITRKSRRSVALAADKFFGEPELTEHRIQRLHGLGQAFHRMAAKDPSIIEVAMGQDAFDEAVERRIEQAVLEQKDVMEKQLRPLRAERERLEAENNQLTQELETLRRHLHEESERFKQNVETQAQQVMHQQQYLLEERDRLLRDFWTLRGLLDGEAASLARATALAAAETASSAEMPDGTQNHLPHERTVELADEPQQLASQLLHALGGDAERLPAFETLHTAVHQHHLFALPDNENLQWFTRYATALGPGTRMHHVIVEAGWTNSQSLFGRVNPNTRRFEPAPGGAIDFWIEAIELNESGVGGMQFLVLNDANRSPMEVWMARLLLAASAPESFRISLFDPRQVMGDDNFLKYAALPWPDNLRVVCVMTTDPYSYEPTDSLNQRLPIVTVARDEPLPPLATVDGYKSVPANKVLAWDWTTVSGELV